MESTSLPTAALSALFLRQ